MEERSTAICGYVCMCACVCVCVCTRVCTCVCARAYAHARARDCVFSTAPHDVETLLALHGGHDSMTSTGRVLFSKGDSTVATSYGEIARWHKQPEHVAIENEGTTKRASKEVSERNMSKGLARLHFEWKVFYFY